jgi:GT2 family glycosyltransferase
MIKLAILMTCFNRSESTVRCLTQISNQLGIENASISIYLVDDGSTDGTTEKVRSNFPSVNVIQGTGDLYWNGGMRLAWQYALKQSHDHFLWINDDSYIFEDAIQRLLKAYEDLLERGENPGALVGSMASAETGKITYGGRSSVNRFNPLKNKGIMEPGDKCIECDFINGNLTLIAGESVAKIGILSDKFTHGMGDFDYGLRLKKAGLSCWVAPGIYGNCEANASFSDWRDTSLPMEKRVTLIQKITHNPPPREWMQYVRMHGGIFWPMLWISAWLRLKFPAVWIRLKDLSK